MPLKEVIIVIPAYNEEKNIEPLIRNIKTKVSDIDILVVDDGSLDRTARVAEDSGAIALRLPFNMGYGAALQTGFKYALMKRYRYAIQMDADGQHDPESIRLLLNEIRKEEVDVVIGSRFLDDKNVYKSPIVRKIGIGLFGKIASIVTGMTVSDPTSGFQALNRDALRFYSSKYYPVDYPDADVIIMLYRAGLRVKEVSVVMHNRLEGTSMHSGIIKPMYYVFKMFLSMFVTLLRRDKFVRRVVRREEIKHAASPKDICHKH
ncbi:MAG: glycosyltransferase family 2 protein [Nitrospirae bacterium]|nr:glycosyltransferase family 2 protein [Nitrospirota bacterium]